MVGRLKENLDNQLRSVLFQVAPPGDPACEDNLDGPGLTQCFKGVVDLGALDVERDRDHGMPSYNDLRKAYGLVPTFFFAEITGDSTENFPPDAELTSSGGRSYGPLSVLPWKLVGVAVETGDHDQDAAARSTTEHPGHHQADRHERQGPGEGVDEASLILR